MKDVKKSLEKRQWSKDDGYDTDSEQASEDLADGLNSVVTEEADFGILFDIDGVLARGSTPLTAAIQAIRLLEDDDGRLRVPVAFVTNACNRSHDKAAQLQKWLDIQVTADQVVHAPTPVKLLKRYHDKHTLVIGQEYREDIARELGFTNICTIEDIQNAYPLLDMVDHHHRNAVAKGNHPDDSEFPAVEAILLLGEPIRWESNLQLLADLLLTGGVPNRNHAKNHKSEVKQLPVIACNMDLVFMHQACMPRFGHGAFLVCLEALFKKLTGRELEYAALIGKPCEITYRYAEHVIGHVAKTIGVHRPLRKLYFVGDNPNVDIVGANLYSRYLKQFWRTRDHNGNLDDVNNGDIPACRKLPRSRDIPEHTVREMESILVGTGVYSPDDVIDEEPVYYGHRDFADEPEMTKPSKYVSDVHAGIQYILEKEKFNPNNVVTAQPSVPEMDVPSEEESSLAGSGIPHDNLHCYINAPNGRPQQEETQMFKLNILSELEAPSIGRGSQIDKHVFMSTLNIVH